MIILDTNVLSELVRPRPLKPVQDWVAQYDLESVFITAITEAEIRFGLACLPDGQRRSELGQRTDHMFEAIFAERMLPFDHYAVPYYAEIAARRRTAGRPVSMADAMLGAIALAHGYPLATGNTRDFEDTGVRLLNPFEAP